MTMLGLSASADGGPPYRRTTPRGSFGADGALLVVGVPGGRAWGIESALMPVPGERTGFRATGRPRQFALTDATFVHAGETTSVVVALDPPAGAIAYRLRVLARLRSPAALSASDAVRVALSSPFSWLAGFPPIRLLP